MRSIATRAGVVAATAVLALTGLGAATASAATTTADAPVAADVTYASLAGEWLGSGTAGSNQVEPHFFFYGNGTLKMIPEDNAYLATGTWKQSGTSFTFHLEHPIYDSTGAVAFYIKADQTGTINGDTWNSTGTSGRYDTQGNLIETFTVTLTAHRV
ncbi:hypothetical protein [Streptomyces achromogenes]|uniref:hypothetical protein n=1 Tax=Streptomyces achromogenes TaxID=67255 RepID=UPI0036776BC9